MYIFCRGKPSSAVFPQRLKGNLRVLTFPSARLIIKQEEKQVEGPQCDGEIFLFSSATACWSPSWGLPPPAIPASNLPFISSSCLPSFLPTFSFTLPTSFLLFLFSFLCSIKHRFSFFFQLRLSSISSHFLLRFLICCQRLHGERK